MANGIANKVLELPLSEKAARNIMRDLAENHTYKIRWSRHVKQRMLERGVLSGQIYALLKNRHSVFREGPYRTSSGDWKFNLKGSAAGDLIELVVVLKNHERDPSAKLISVWIR